jgi:hypothetical protein
MAAEKIIIETGTCAKCYRYFNGTCTSNEFCSPLLINEVAPRLDFDAPIATNFTGYQRAFRDHVGNDGASPTARNQHASSDGLHVV